MATPEISFRPFDSLSLDDCRLMAKWENDPEIREMFQVFADEAALGKQSTPEIVAARYKSFPAASIYGCYLVLLDERPVGEINFFIDLPPIISEKLNTAWIGIVIGEAHARGRGVGRQAMHELERQVRLAGARRIELGVFEFNTGAIEFYKRLGYREFARLPNFAYYRGRKWDDVRMIKEFE